jgi:glutaredoxin-related protein
LDASHATDHARERVAAYHRDLIDEVRTAVDTTAIVVVGMARNPHCARARRVLDDARLDHRYLEYGSYLHGWRRRLALKMWSGWPTFPMVFVQGVLIGGADELGHMVHDGSLRARLDGREHGHAGVPGRPNDRPRAE